MNAVPQVYYGFAKGLAPKQSLNSEYIKHFSSDDTFDIEVWRNKFLEVIKEMFNEHDCYICKNKVPEEGVVIRIEDLECEAYKAKSEAFYARETAQLDKGESNIEDEN